MFRIATLAAVVLVNTAAACYASKITEAGTNAPA